LPDDAAEEEAVALAADLLDLLSARRLDHTAFFRALAEGRAGELAAAAPRIDVAGGLGLSPAGAAVDPGFAAWERRRLALAGSSAAQQEASRERMLAANPV